MASVSSATFSGHGARSLLQFLRLVGQLKRVPRTGWVYRNVQRPESVSDHMYRMAVMAMVIKDDRLNKDRCVRLALVHDMAECIVGDIAPADNIPKEEKHRREEEAMKQITQLLPEDLRKELYELWEIGSWIHKLDHTQVGTFWQNYGGILGSFVMHHVMTSFSSCLHPLMLWGFRMVIF
ncbi:5'-deoxynucleotidase HDDC2 isoform X3 [Pongo abelii]|uniref:5'-deoxynucleotidase HDDC2 isoform X3 n=1 Tax=Pongo abelii TaxID=9601 RepID=UPI0023E8991C|nr:5'-deoxynucleotidase HDDC2 isoform X3 [Pongo abelii]